MVTFTYFLMFCALRSKLSEIQVCFAVLIDNLRFWKFILLGSYPIASDLAIVFSVSPVWLEFLLNSFLYYKFTDVKYYNEYYANQGRNKSN